MADEGFFRRLADGGLFRILTGYDLYLSLLLAVAVGWYTDGNLSSYNLSGVVDKSVGYSTSLTAVIVTGIAIIVALSDTTFLKLLKRKKVFQNFLFTFEYTALLSIVVSVYGIYVSSIEFGRLEFLAFLWLFLYLVLAVSRVISQIVSLGVRRGDVSLIEELAEIVEDSAEDDQGEIEREEN
ncbi:hypothetical protein [Halomarina oriensis]|uniref:Uncharacterized protein n=1 Tax=Halomarina oriensis TaxID=671145 RepID=A0A6B0GH35_9EURY|nr:hypothetical protein [Halomarina oriensis]MWG33890.1 hypothetical protein [Halomarina oriensis]